MYDQPNTSDAEVHRETDPVLNPDEDLRVTRPEWFGDPDEEDENEESETPSQFRIAPAIARPPEVSDTDRRSRAVLPLHVFWAEQFLYNNQDLAPTHAGCVYIGHRDGKDWQLDEEYDMWLPVEQDLFRELWFKFFERVRSRKSDFLGYWPAEWTPALVNSILDHARFLRYLPARLTALVTEHELVSFADTVAPARWLARRGHDKLLPADAVGVLYGQRATCKSFVAVELAAAIATGERNLHGIELDYPDESWVLYLGAEDALGLQRRLRAACERRALTMTPRYRLLKGQPVMTDPAAVQQLVRELKRAIPAGAPVALVVIDTYNLSRGPDEDENSADSAGRFVAGMKLLGRAFSGATVAVVHHENRKGTERGSLALGDNSDFMFRFEREAPHAVKLTCAKQKGAAEPPPLTLGLADSPDGLMLASVAAASAALESRKGAKDPLFDHEQKALVFRALAKAEPAGLTYGEWKRAASSAGTFSAAKAVMEDREFVSQEPSGRYRLSLSGREQAALRGWLSQQIV